jgi:hypothetical protein
MVKPAEQDEMKAVCSACFAAVPVERTHVQPGYNDLLRAYVTTYRCDNCWAAGLAATRARVAACTDPGELDTAVVFFSRYGVAVPGLMPGDPPGVVRDRLLALLDRLASGEVRLKIDTRTTIPLKLPPPGPPGKDPPFGGGLTSWLPTE